MIRFMISLDKKYSVGIESIDNEHKNFFEIFTKILAITFEEQSEESNKNLQIYLSELKDYTNYHFSHEAKLFEEHHYPAKFPHMEEHKFFVAKLKEVEAHLRQDIAPLNELVGFLRDWFIHHILTSDNQYSEFFKNLGVK